MDAICDRIDNYPYLMEKGSVMNRLLGATVFSVMLVATSLVFAQQQPKTEQPTPPEQQTQQTGQGMVEFIDEQQQSNWMTSALIGRNVTNSQGETLGDINDIIIDEQGKVVAVVIGVGGFLGIGEKNVGVRYTNLQFEPILEQQRAPAPTPTQQPGTDPTRQAPRPEPVERPQSTQEDSKHRDKRIVLDVSKEQLESAPFYRKLGDKKETEN
jgi:sporulation protein YlmC with PRC-barrel domain